ncbi:hypothetical protein ACIBI9_66045 [Nonomuraea sp. NPDC050451]|uniref:hypothetical protein n=1 Tax=Nonomuraea sp. NPDC050451 TaxID=3364364 RepID=UPI0037996415
MDEISLLNGMEADVPPVSAHAHAQTRAALLAEATAERAADSGSKAGTAPRSAPSPASPLAGWIKSLSGRRLRIGLVAAGLALSAAIVVPLATGSENPAHAAYLLSKNANGTITITINQFTEAEKLEEDLRQLGVAAVVDYVPEGKHCQEPRARYLGDSVSRVVQAGTDPDGKTTFTLHPESIEPGQTLVATATFNDPTDSSSGSAIGFELAEGQVAPCAQIASN